MQEVEKGVANESAQAVIAPEKKRPGNEAKAVMASCVARTGVYGRLAPYTPPLWAQALKVKPKSRVKV